MKRYIFAYVLLMFIAFASNAQVKFTNYGCQNLITCLAEDGNKIWEGTTGGIIVRNKTNGIVTNTYTTANGLISNSITHLAVDASNNIWIATLMGVQKFDGVNWTTYTNENTNGGLPDNNVLSLCFDLQNNLWCGTANNGATKYNGTSWITYDTLNSGIVENYVTDIAADNSGKMWFATFKGVSEFDGTNWITFDSSAASIPLYRKIESNYVNKIFVDPYNVVWFGTDFSLEKCIGTTIDTNYNILIIWDINMDSNNDLWISTLYGVSKFDDTTFTPYTSYNSSITTSVNSILIDNQNNKWFGTSNGLCKYDNTNWNKYDISNTLVNNYVRDVITDNNGNIWFATFAAGVSKLSGNNNWATFDNTNGLTIVNTYSIAVDLAGNKWFGTVGSLSKYNDTTITDYLSGNYIFDIQIDSIGNIWAATMDSGVYVLKTNGTIIRRYNTSNSGLEADAIRSLAFDKTGNVWFGMQDSGLYKLSSANVWTHYNVNSGLAFNKIRDLVVDSLNNVWVATFGGGISKLSGNTFTNYYSSNSPVPDDNTTAINIDNNGNIWAGFEEEIGIVKFDGTHWIKYYIPDGLGGEKIYKIYVDKATNDIWVGTNFGASKITCEAPVVNFNADTICFTTNGLTQFTDLSTKIDSTSKYSWDIYNDGFPESTGRNFTYHFPSAGIYPVNLTVSNENCSSTITKYVVVGSIPNISIAETLSACSGNQLNISPVINNYDSALSYNYLWNTGATTTSINVTSTGNYSVIVSDNNCYSIADSIYIDIKYPYAGDGICVVSYDTTTGKNIIAWNKTPVMGTAFYNIYKETAANVYNPIGNLQYGDMSVFVDINSNPAIKTDKYKISVVDTCGNESPLCNFHKTMHLTVNHGNDNVNTLLWSKYEGITYTKFKIYRGFTPDNLILIDTVLNNITTYADTIFYTGKVYYCVAVELAGTCAAHTNKANGITFTEAMSNIIEINTQNIDNVNYETYQMIIYPNPVTDIAIIYFNNKGNKNYTLTITDIEGKIVKEISNIKTSRIEFSRAGIPNGIYLLELKGDKLLRGRIVVGTK